MSIGSIAGNVQRITGSVVEAVKAACQQVKSLFATDIRLVRTSSEMFKQVVDPEENVTGPYRPDSNFKKSGSFSITVTVIGADGTNSRKTSQVSDVQAADPDYDEVVLDGADASSRADESGRQDGDDYDFVVLPTDFASGSIHSGNHDVYSLVDMGKKAPPLPLTPPPPPPRLDLAEPGPNLAQPAFRPLPAPPTPPKPETASAVLTRKASVIVKPIPTPRARRQGVQPSTPSSPRQALMPPAEKLATVKIALPTPAASDNTPLPSGTRSAETPTAAKPISVKEMAARLNLRADGQSLTPA